MVVPVKLSQVVVLIAIIGSLNTYSAEDASIPNGGFEDGLANWGNLWTRDSNVGQAILDTEIRHSGTQSVRIEHRGERDWSFNPNRQLAVEQGDFFEFDAWLKVEGSGSGTICVVLYDARNTVIDWVFAERTVSGTHDWTHLTATFIVPQDVRRIHPRLIGHGPATVWMDDFNIVKKGNVLSELPGNLTIENESLIVTLHSSDATLSVLDKRNDTAWKQKALSHDIALINAAIEDGHIRAKGLHTTSGLEMELMLQIDRNEPEWIFTLMADGVLPQSIQFPHPFVTGAGTYLVVPMNEGISYPVDDPSISPFSLIAYGGHGICMPFWGVTDGVKGLMAIIETPDDAGIQIGRQDSLLYISPRWESQKGQFGYHRQLRYTLLENGGHAAIAKRYRRYAQETGLFKTLAQKQSENPNVDKLIGAVNVWCWENNALSIVKEMKALGIERILWSHRESPSTIESMIDMGILSSRYDIYQDVMNPDNFKNLNGVHPDWPTSAWPNDLMLDEKGDWRKGWEVKGKDGQMYPCGVLCDRQAPVYARERIVEELKTYPYQCRFIDTTTASPWRECHHPDHPMTRSESRKWKMELLRIVSEEMGLICGSETGHDAAVPFVHYFEGMLSLGPYRVPDAGRNMIEPWDEVPERVAKFQLGHSYRLPLWELVYHDCVVAQWYWGDYNNKLPSLWDKRDLFNILYATPPMFMFNNEIWNKNKERFVKSYRAVCPVVRAVGYEEMVDHRFLKPDRSVQQTRFSNGITITVNFSELPYVMADNTVVLPLNYRIAGLNSSSSKEWPKQ